MKKGFTMIELVFVIVILGVLAAVIIPRLAATREDARLATVKQDIGVLITAIPSWYLGQKDIRISKAVNLDAQKWVSFDSLNEFYVLSLDEAYCVEIGIWNIEINATDGSVIDAHVAVSGTDYDATNGSWIATSGSPVFRVINIPASYDYPSTVSCDTLWNEMGVSERNISLGGKKVRF